MQTVEDLDKAIVLLNESIGVWERVIDKPDNAFDVFYEHECPLCEEYQRCVYCPIYADTGQESCEGTVYYSTRPSRDETATIEHDNEMLDYLEDLRDRLEIELHKKEN